MHEICLLANLLHEMGLLGYTKENAQLNRQNDFSFIDQINILLKKKNAMM